MELAAFLFLLLMMIAVKELLPSLLPLPPSVDVGLMIILIFNIILFPIAVNTSGKNGSFLIMEFPLEHTVIFR